MARPGRVTVTFGVPLTLTGQDYAELAKRVEEAVKARGTTISAGVRARARRVANRQEKDESDRSLRRS